MGIDHAIHHAHPQIEVNLVLGGEGFLEIEGLRHELAPGSLIWIAPCQEHRLERSREFEMWLAVAEPDWLDAAFLAGLDSVQHRVLGSAEVMELDQLMRMVSQDSADPPGFRAGVVYAMRRARRMSMSTIGPVQKRLHPAVLSAIALLRENVEAPASAELARLCGVTRDYLGQLLVEQTGRGLVEWRNRTRLERFHLVYPDSGDLLTAALGAGFGSYTQFHRVFAEMTGITPGQWVKSGAGAGRIQTTVARDSSEPPWMHLAGAAPPTLSRWFKPVFAARTLDGNESDMRPIPTGLTEHADFRLCEPQLVGDMQARDPAMAERLAQTFAEHDIFETFLRLNARFPLPLDDMATVVTGYLAIAQVATNTGPQPSPDYIGAMARRIRAALHAGRHFDRATLPERRYAAAAIVAQTIFIYNSFYSGLSSGSPARRAELAEAVHGATRDIMGLDLRELELARQPLTRTAAE